MNAKARLIPYWLVALCALSACSQGASTAPSGVGANAASAVTAPISDAASSGTPGNRCDVITAADMAGILTTPVKSELDPSGRECHYATPSAYVSIIAQQIRPGNEMAWKVATTYNHVDVPLAGIGDTAMRNANGTKLAARKGDTYCGIQVVGYDSPDSTVTRDRGDALAKKLGVLCNKLFASH